MTGRPLKGRNPTRDGAGGAPANAADLALGQILAFQQLDRCEPGQWSLAQGQTSLLVKNSLLSDGNGLYMELLRAVPVPNRDVPLQDILSFREKRSSELGSLQYEVEGLTTYLSQGSSNSSQLSRHIKKIDKSCLEAINASREMPFPIRLSNLKVPLDPSAF